MNIETIIKTINIQIQNNLHEFISDNNNNNNKESNDRDQIVCITSGKACNYVYIYLFNVVNFLIY